MPEEQKIESIRAESRRREESIWNEINSIRHTIYGNGDNGMHTDIALIKKDLESIIRNEKSRKTKEWTLIVGVLGLIIEQIFTRFMSG